MSSDNVARMSEAKQAILRLLDSGAPDIIDLMLAASEYVDTLRTDLRMELRQFIVDNGGSLTVPPERMAKIFPSAEMRNAAISNSADLESHICLWPIGVNGELTCGRPIADAETLSTPSLQSNYCDEHAPLAVQPGSSGSRSSYRAVPSRRVNSALRNRASKTGPRWDG